MSMRRTIGSRIPSGSSLRTRATASRTSLTARSTGVPIWNSTVIIAWPSIAREVMCLTLPMLATAPSIFCMICASISLGAAPGCTTMTSTKGAEMSGLRVIGKRTKAIAPNAVSTANRISGKTGWRIAQAEMLRTVRAPAQGVPAAACATCGF